MGGIEIQLQEWVDLQKKIEGLEKGCNETNQRLDRIEALLTTSRNMIFKWAGKFGTFTYRSIALYILYRIATQNPEVATAMKDFLLP